ncbi:hypothetical protein SMICM304S_03956 [Streptomyces microflavus]
MTTTVAFIGLGHMGGPMAANLVRAGGRARWAQSCRSQIRQPSPMGVAESGVVQGHALGVRQ